MNVVLNGFVLSRKITWMFSYLGFSDQKMHFLFKMSLMIVNKGSSLTVFNKGSFFETIVYKIDRLKERPFKKTTVWKYIDR